MPERKTRIADVARRAGVSTATVSRALSDPARVGAETRARVLSAVQDTGYRVNAAARDLRSARARAVTVLVPNLSNTFFSRIVAAIQEVAGAAGLTVQVSDSSVEGDRLATLGRDGRSDGVLLFDGGLDPALVAGWGVPVVLVCERIEGVPWPQLGVDNAVGIALAVDHLAGLGHRRLAYLGGPEGNVLSRDRAAGFERACARHGLRPRDEDRLPGDFTMGSGAQAARRWAGTVERATAVVCASDESAIGFISECDRMGLSVPRDVSVTGFDDVEFSERFIPPLTTVRQPRAEIGRAAAETLVALLTDGPPPPAADLPLRLVVRGSTSPLH